MDLRPQTLEFLLKATRPRPDLSPWDWCAQNVVFPPKLYPSNDHGPFNPNRLLFWREPMELACTGKMREIIILKPSQSCCTETVGQMAVRWYSVNKPRPILWVGAQQEQLENFLLERLFPGVLHCGETLAEALEGYTQIGRSIVAPNGARLFGTWAKSLGGTKGKSYGLVVADEVDTYSSFAMEKLRPRITNWPDGVIVAISAMDAKKKTSSDKSPIFLEWKDTDRREYMFPDPACPTDFFRFEMGWRADNGESPWGLKWSREARGADGRWNESRVAETVHFVTPGGAKIFEPDRIKLLNAGGTWIPTATGRQNAAGFRGTSFMLLQKSMADIALDFLRAKRGGKDMLRTFILEQLAEEWYEQKITIGDTIVDARKADYAIGERMSTSRTFEKFYVGQKGTTILTGDVQKIDIYGLVREWMPDGSSGLVEWFSTPEWEAIEAFAQKHKVAMKFIDANYPVRRREVIEYASNYPWVVPCFGHDNRMEKMIKVNQIPAHEGTSRMRRDRLIGVLIWDTWAIKYHLFNLMLGKFGQIPWRIPKNVQRDYAFQMASEEFIDGKFEEKHKANHLLDCEAEQVLGALWLGLLSPFNSAFAMPNKDDLANKGQQLLSLYE